MFSVKIIADSLAPSKKRLTTYEVTYERMIHAELLTHRMLSRNSSSSRAIPIGKMLDRVKNDPVVPIWWGLNEKGMQSYTEAPPELQEKGKAVWLRARDQMVAAALELSELGFHKQIANRLVEPFMWITVVVSSTTWSNFFGLRDHVKAEPHFQRLAKQMRAARAASVPQRLHAGEWHLPYIYPEDHALAKQMVLQEWGQPELTAAGICDEAGWYDDRTVASKDLRSILAKVSAGRVARVSYLTHDGRRDLKEDIALCERLASEEPMHASPLEHVAMALDTQEPSGNFKGFKQLRKFFENGESIHMSKGC